MYTPIRITGPNVYDDNYEARQPVHDGQCFQPGSPTEVVSRLQVVEATPARDLSLSQHQEWVELNWKAEHGTWTAAERFREGFFGELAEYIEANTGIQEIESYASEWGLARLIDQAHDDPEKHKAVVSELGDVMWYGAAILSNAGVSLEHAARVYLHDKWLPVGFEDPIAIGDVDQRIADGFVPYAPSRRHVSQLFLDDHSIQDVGSRDLFMAGYWLTVAVSKMFNYGDPDVVNLGGYLQQQRQLMEPLGGHLLHSLAHVARNHANSSLAEVLEVNIAKINARADSGHLDKTDGQRLADEL